VGTFFAAGFLFFLMKENDRLRGTLHKIAWHPCSVTNEYEMGAKQMIGLAQMALKDYE
jgi:hypothetical protein